MCEPDFILRDSKNIVGIVYCNCINEMFDEYLKPEFMFSMQLGDMSNIKVEVIVH